MILGEVEWGYCSDNTFDLVFTNHITGETETRNYKTHRSAACAETKFHNRMSRIYSSRKERTP
jgi:hypothetical protein